MADQHMLTTTDNPFDPRTQWDEWRTWDYPRYDTNGLLARVVRTSNDLTEGDNALAIEQGIDEIVTQNASGVHMKLLIDQTSSAEN